MPLTGFPSRPIPTTFSFVAAVCLGCAAAVAATSSPKAPHPAHLEIVNITGRPQLAFAPAGKVMPVTAIARIVVAVDIDSLMAQCFSAKHHMINWWEAAPVDTYARQFFDGDDTLRATYTNAQDALHKACYQLASWKSMDEFFTQSTDDDKPKRSVEDNGPSQDLLDLSHFALADPVFRDPANSTATNAGARVRRIAVTTIVAVIGGASLLAGIVALLLGAGRPAWSQQAAAEYTAKGAEHNTKAIQQLVGKIKDVHHFDHMQQLINGIRDYSHDIINTVYRVRQAMTDLQHGQVSPIFLTPSEIRKAMRSLSNKASQVRMHPAVQTVADVLLLPAFGVIASDKILRVIIPVPIVKESMPLHRYAGTPLLVANHTTQVRRLMTPHPDHTAIAISPTSSSHALLTMADLSSCLKLRSTYLCVDLPLRLNRYESCLGALFSAHSGAIHTHCTFVPHAEDWHVAHTGPGRYAWSTTRATAATTTCPSGASISTHISWGVHSITVPPGCTTQTEHFSINTPLTPFATAEVYKSLDWDMEAPLLLSYSNASLSMTATNHHIAAANHDLFNAHVAAANADSSWGFWHYAAVLAAGSVMTIACAGCIYYKCCRSSAQPSTNISVRTDPPPVAYRTAPTEEEHAIIFGAPKHMRALPAPAAPRHILQ